MTAQVTTGIKFSYLGVGTVLGVATAVITFIGAYIYCIASYGFLFGLGLGWLPSIILAGLVGGAMVFLWGAVLALGVPLALAAAFLFSSKLLGAMAIGATAGWVIWRVSPKSMRGG